MAGETFVGRAEELRVLERAVADGIRGRPRVVLVTGEPGVGKTALVLEAARRATERAESSRTRVAVGRAWDGAGAPSFWLWRECFRALGETLDVQDLTEGSIGAEARFATLAAIAERVREAARTMPLVIVLDDIQWADAPSLHALRLTCRMARAERLCVFGTVREPSELSAEAESILASVRREATVLALGGLSRSDLAELARASGVDRERAVDALATATRGNTLFAIEILEDRDARIAIDEGRAVPATGGVRDVLRRHLARIDERERDVVSWAAAFGTPIDLAAIAAAASLSPATVAAAIDTACRERVLVRDGGTVRFAHELFRDAAYSDLPASRRMEMHLAFARALADRDPTSLGRVRHLFAAHPDDANEAVADVALAAASTAITRLAYEDAANVAHRAAMIYERRGSRAAFARAKAVVSEALVLRGDVEGSVREAQEALTIARETTDAVAFARAALALGLRRVVGASNLELVAALDEALARVDAANIEDPGLRCALEARLAAALQPTVDSKRALSSARRAIDRARETNDPAILARTLHAARPAFRLLEPLDERRSMDRELLQLSERLGDPVLAAHARTRCFWTAIESGDGMTADTTLADLERTTAKLALPAHELSARLARCVREMMQGNFDAARAKIDEIESTRERWEGTLASSWLVDPVDIMRMNLAALRGEVVPALRGAPPPFTAIIDLFLRARTVEHGTAEAADLEGQVERILGVYLRDEVWYMTRVFAGDAITRLRMPMHAHRFYELCLPFEGRHVVWTPMPGYDGAMDRLLGALAALRGDRTRALRHYDAAIAMEEALGARPFVERSLRERAEIAPTSARVQAKKAASAAGPSFVREGETWLVTWRDETTRLKDADGLRYLAYLVARPRVPVPVVELFAERASATGEAPPPSGDAGEVLDREAIASYRRRARELKEALEEAKARNDRGAIEAVRNELAFLEDELTKSVGLGGRIRRASSDTERIRVNVTTRIRKVIERLRAETPSLAGHLEASVKTGTTCSYEPVTS